MSNRLKLRSSIEVFLLDEQGLRATLLHYFPTALPFDVAGSSVDSYIMNGMSPAVQELREAKAKLPYGAKVEEAKAVRDAYTNLKRRVKTLRERLRAEVYGAYLPTL